mgnify:CR=1 FL=1
MIKKIFPKGQFTRNLITLMTGATIAQAVPLAIMPILTRIYSPEDFGLFAIYLAILSIISVAATGRYELSIMLPQEDADARILLQASVIIAFSISVILFILMILFAETLSIFLGNSDIEKWLYLIPVAIFMNGLYQALIYWTNRQKKFKDNAVSRVNQSLSQGFFQTFFSLVKQSGGLILGQTLGIFFGTLYLSLKNKNYKYIISAISIKKIMFQLRRYSNFPKYSIGGAVCDSAAVQMPILILTKYYSSALTGMFSLTFKVLSIPSALISSALTQVLFQKIVEINNTNPERLHGFVCKVFIYLFIIFLPVIPLMWFFGEDIFSFVFGEKWRVAGTYAGYLTIAVAVRFCISPLSAIMTLNNNVKKGVVWQILYLVTITTTLLLSSKLNIESFIQIYVIHEVILYFIYLILILRSSLGEKICVE